MYDGKVVDTSIIFLTLYIQYDKQICTYDVVNMMYFLSIYKKTVQSMICMLNVML